MMIKSVISAPDKKKTVELNRIIRYVSNSRESSFYKDIWRNAHLKNTEIGFETLPVINIGNIIKCKFDDRTYIKNGLFVKIIYHENVPYLLARTKDDISKEDFGETKYGRPLVFFENSHESIEKALWLHDKNILPLVAEDNLNVVLMTAARYEIDSIVGDALSVKKLLQVQSGLRHFDHGKITAVTVIDSHFGENLHVLLSESFPSAKIDMILALPETGSLGRVCQENKDGKLVFHPVDNTVVEICGNRLVATRIILLPTPIIRYETRIETRAENKSCSCESELSFSLQN